MAVIRPLIVGFATTFKHLFKKHGAPQQASGYSTGSKPRGTSSHSHTHQETLGSAEAVKPAAVKAEAAVDTAAASVKA